MRCGARSRAANESCPRMACFAVVLGWLPRTLGDAERAAREPRPARRMLFIIARGEPLMYATVKESFSRHADIDVILDRRHAQRRRLVLPTEVDRRLRERRSFNIDALLRQLGWVIVEQRTNEA
jgi:hypothetical protein